MACNLAVTSLKLTYGSQMWSFASNFNKVIMGLPMCQSGELCCHSVVCAEKIIRVSTQIYNKRKPRSPLNGLATWELDGDETGYLPSFAQPAHLFNRHQGVWEHAFSLRTEKRNRPILLPLQSFSISETQDKVRDVWFRKQVYYLSPSPFSNTEMDTNYTLQYRSAILLQ